MNDKDLEWAKRKIAHWKELEKKKRQNIRFYARIIKYLQRYSDFSAKEIVYVMLEFIKNGNLIEDFKEAYRKHLS